MLPFLEPDPPRLSDAGDALRRLEASGVFSNNGPEVRAFEREATACLFDGRGASLAVSSATAGLMIAAREAAGVSLAPGTFALMPALTFAATAQAALWAGLTPLVCDVDADDWAACAKAEDRLIAEHGARIGVLMPYATFGNAIDLDRYAWLQRRHGFGVVVDAAASLGTRDAAGLAFGAEAPFAIVHSMHATKPFAVAEGGLIHSADVGRIERLRAMANFGFESGRSATMPGLNAKLPEVLALMARIKLDGFGAVCAHRSLLEQAYRKALPGFALQRVAGSRRSIQFMPVLLPERLADDRDRIADALAQEGIGTGRYFSPHLGEQPWIRANATIAPTPVADSVAARLLSLPISDTMTPDAARRVAAVLGRLCRPTRPARAERTKTAIADLLIVGGGPAGTALLTAASKAGSLARLAPGLVVVEEGPVLGGGGLGHYAITSDSTADTFLSAVRDNPHPELAALIHHPAALAVAAHSDTLGVPLAKVGALLKATGDVLGSFVRAQGGSVLCGHRALSATRIAGGLWRIRLRRDTDGHTFDQLARHVVVATGGHQPLDRLVTEQVAGRRLVDLAGDRLLQSDAVLANGGFETVSDLLAHSRAPRIAVIGGSTSAMTTVARLLGGQPGLALGARAITLLHRRPLRPFYPSVAAAEAEAFTDFDERDICPVSGFVYRLAGFRLEARELALRMLAIGGRVPDPRVALHRLRGDGDAKARQILEQADLVIAALGYRPRVVPLLDTDGSPIPLAVQAGSALVDRHCRIVDAGGAPIAGLFGIGLAAGFVPWGALGGEPSFSGQANGLWLWQNAVGHMIVDQVLETRTRAAA